MYKSEQSLELLYNLYIDFLKGSEEFYTQKQDDGKLYHVRGIKDGWGMSVGVVFNMGNWVDITVIPPKD